MALRLRPAGRLTVLLLSVLLSSCAPAKRGNVSGKVSFNARPVVYGSVVFIGSDDTPVTSAINADGTYSVSGVPAGLVRVGVVSRDPSTPRPPTHVLGVDKSKLPKAETEAPKIDRSKWFRLPEQYEQVATSGITTTIQSGDNTFDIDLK